jgi:hypothetical protein
MKKITINEIGEEIIDGVKVCLISFNRIHNYLPLNDAFFSITKHKDDYLLNVKKDKNKTSYIIKHNNLKTIESFSDIIILEESVKNGNINYIAKVML